MPPPIRTRRLLLDAFGTLFSPRLPVHEQYDLVARRMGICVDQLLLKGSFKRCEYIASALTRRFAR